MTDYLLLEVGDFLLKEDEYKIILLLTIDSGIILRAQDNDFIIKAEKNTIDLSSSNSLNIILQEATTWQWIRLR